MSIKIVTDSTSYIPEDIRKELDIEMLSLSVLFGDEDFKETEITNESFFKKLNDYDGFPKSSQPSMDDMVSLYDKILSKGHDLIGVFISSDMSGTYSTAIMMKNEMEEKYPDRKIAIIDSRSNCMQLGLITISGANAIKEGKSFDEVVGVIKHTILNSRFVFMPDTLEYLRKGGRIGTAKALLGSVLQIKPILTVLNGMTHTITKVRTRKKALAALVETFNVDITEHSFLDAYVQHIDCEDEAKALAKLIEQKTGKIIEIAPIGPVIGTHVGPGAIGIAYCWR